MAVPKENEVMEKLVSLCKRRGFVFQSSDIYGGINGFWDYGPLGAELKRNVKECWWTTMTRLREDVVGLDATIIMHPRIWQASGHVDTFSDPMCDCLLTRKRFRADQIEPQSGLAYHFSGARDTATGRTLTDAYAVLLPPGKPPESARRTAAQFYAARGLSNVELQGERTEKVENSTRFNPENGSLLTEPRPFNLMFKTYVGPVGDESAIAYLRPETAQAIFAQFKNVLETSRQKVPFGIAQVGKAFRNEVTPRNFTFRTREFEQMELEFFVPPAEGPQWYEYWCNERLDWYVRHGIPTDLLRIRAHDDDELSHYSTGTSDVEFMFPWGWDELEGIAQRTDYDLKQHSQHSGERLDYFDQPNNERYVPYVIEPAAGATRTMAAFLLAAYDEEEVGDGDKSDIRTVLRLHPRLAPYKVAVLPLSKKDTLTPLAHEVRRMVGDRYMVDYDETQSIGKRYRRQDEIGTPLCITVDFDSLDDNAVTVRERDTMEQVRVPIAELMPLLTEKLGF
ncbi:MAG: glycine--tRNA ligase [Ilumatobacter sp.]|nr:glycine--tRNA ligase [Ilumatobacter sp.]